LRVRLRWQRLNTLKGSGFDYVVGQGLDQAPWARADVVMTLVARDEAMNEGRSSTHEFWLDGRCSQVSQARFAASGTASTLPNPGE
jgi:hypothetical protein